MFPTIPPRRKRMRSSFASTKNAQSMANTSVSRWKATSSDAQHALVWLKLGALTVCHIFTLFLIWIEFISIFFSLHSMRHANDGRIYRTLRRDIQFGFLFAIGKLIGNIFSSARWNKLERMESNKVEQTLFNRSISQNERLPQQQRSVMMSPPMSFGSAQICINKNAQETGWTVYLTWTNIYSPSKQDNVDRTKSMNVPIVIFRQTTNDFDAGCIRTEPLSIK